MAYETMRFEDGGEDLCDRVVQAVSVTVNKEPSEITPIYEVCDPDALRELFDPPFDAGNEFDGRLMFSYEGCEVTIVGGGEVRIRVKEAID